MAGTGYTGEDGVELAVPAERGRGRVGRACWPPASCPPGSAPATRCASRPALPLHGHELGPGITPAPGRSRLGGGLGQAGRLPGPGRARSPSGSGASPGACAGLATDGRRPPRADQAVLVDGKPVGVVTSGNFSPVLGHGIALAFLPPGVAEGAEVAIDVRGEAVPATVVPTPFVTR